MKQENKTKMLKGISLARRSAYNQRSREPLGGPNTQRGTRTLSAGAQILILILGIVAFSWAVGSSVEVVSGFEEGDAIEYGGREYIRDGDGKWVNDDLQKKDIDITFDDQKVTSYLERVDGRSITPATSDVPTGAATSDVKPSTLGGFLGMK